MVSDSGDVLSELILVEGGDAVAFVSPLVARADEGQVSNSGVHSMLGWQLSGGHLRLCSSCPLSPEGRPAYYVLSEIKTISMLWFAWDSTILVERGDAVAFVSPLVARADEGQVPRSVKLTPEFQ